jgi:hypothetical protein
MKTPIRAAINAYPVSVRDSLVALRALILKTARETRGVGKIEEDLRWGQPSFLTSETGSGSTIRIDGFRQDPGRYAIFFHCQSGLVDQFRQIYGNDLVFIGRRGIELRIGQPLPKSQLKHCISLALTHHLRKKQHPSR